MEINLLVLNVGNARLAIGVFVAGEIQQVRRISHQQRDEWPAAISQAWALIRGRDNAAIAGASVNPNVLEDVETIIVDVAGAEAQWVGRQIEVPINVLTDSPEQTGVDRIVTMAAAYEQIGKACVVIDAGTAITINCCNDAGEFLGGAISPGVSMQLDALHRGTAQLPLLDFQVPKGPFGKSTEQAILQGIYHGVRGMVKELVENYATALGSWPDVIATGGDAQRLFEGWELIHAISPDLALYGIALAYTNHHIKHGF